MSDDPDPGKGNWRMKALVIAVIVYSVVALALTVLGAIDW